MLLIIFKIKFFYFGTLSVVGMSQNKAQRFAVFECHLVTWRENEFTSDVEEWSSNFKYVVTLLSAQFQGQVHANLATSGALLEKDARLYTRVEQGDFTCRHLLIFQKIFFYLQKNGCLWEHEQWNWRTILSERDFISQLCKIIWKI